MLIDLSILQKTQKEAHTHSNVYINHDIKIVCHFSVHTFTCLQVNISTRLAT